MIPAESFENLIKSAAEIYVEADNYPPIDVNLPDFNSLWEVFHGTPAEADEIRIYWENKLAQASNDLAVRFAVLNYYYRLVHLESHIAEEFVSDTRIRFLRDLCFFVRLRDMSVFRDHNDISWEIINACAIRDWNRVRTLYSRLRDLNGLEPVEFHRAFGHFLFRVAIGGFETEKLGPESEDLAQWSAWATERRPGEDLAFEWELLSIGLGAFLPTPSDFTAQFFREAENELEAAEEKSELRPSLRAALAKCYMARSEHLQAATQYQLLAELVMNPEAITGMALTEVPDDLHESFNTLMRPSQREARLRTVEALRFANALPKLRGFLYEWINSAPDELGPREILAEIEAQASDYRAAFELLSRENSLNPANDNDWKATLLVELGTRASSEEKVLQAVRKSLKRNPELARILAGVLEEYWPTIVKLDPEASSSFKIASRCLFDRGIGPNAWVHATMAAGRCVEFQLKKSVFLAFAASIDRNRPLKPGRPGDRPDPLAAFVRNPERYPLTLGEMLKSLSNTTATAKRTETEEALASWLEQNRPKLSKGLACDALQTTFLKRTRNDATHSFISLEEARRAYRATRQWLEVLT